jgi:hypothetical protein
MTSVNGWDRFAIETIQATGNKRQSAAGALTGGPCDSRAIPPVRAPAHPFRALGRGVHRVTTLARRTTLARPSSARWIDVWPPLSHFPTEGWPRGFLSDDLV